MSDARRQELAGKLDAIHTGNWWDKDNDTDEANALGNALARIEHIDKLNDLSTDDVEVLIELCDQLAAANGVTWDEIQRVEALVAAMAASGGQSGQSIEEAGQQRYDEALTTVLVAAYNDLDAQIRPPRQLAVLAPSRGRDRLR